MKKYDDFLLMKEGTRPTFDQYFNNLKNNLTNFWESKPIKKATVKPENPAENTGVPVGTTVEFDKPETKNVKPETKTKAGIDAKKVDTSKKTITEVV